MRFPFFGKKPVPALPQGWWLIVPLGNPGGEYARTRHNLGRLMLQRWMDWHCSEAQAAPRALRALAFGTIYSLREPFMALVPSTFMNLSGKALLEAAMAGLPVGRMLVVHDDKDLPLGTGRLAVGGGAAGHGGIGSVYLELGTQAVFRLRLGIGPFERPLREWVLGEWDEREWETIGGMDAPFSEFMAGLARARAPVDLMGQVNAPAFWKKTCNGPGSWDNGNSRPPKGDSPCSGDSPGLHTHEESECGITKASSSPPPH
jgi:PTH1 family peptidyl-tRNA hydrolase